jgi:hypothetical protein
MRYRLGALVGLALPCCGDAARSTAKVCEGEPGVSRAAITYGERRASLLGLTDSQERAVVAVLEVAGDSIVSVCSGVVLDSRTVLTARHCTETRGPLRVVVGENTHCPEGEVEVVASSPHPELDLALLTLAKDIVETFGIVPLVVDGSDRYTAGALVQIAGFGLDGITDRPGRRLFAATSVSEVGPTFLSVRAQYGLTGACSGDSGGPALVRDAAGRAAVIGVLSKGASDCAGEDMYVRLTGAGAWLPPAPVDVSVPCGGIDDRGGCFYDVAQRCEDGRLLTETCTSPERCVWTAGGFFGCGDSARAACGAITQLGECQGESAVTCDGGALEASDCAPGQCARSPKDGTALCVDLPK